MNKKINSLMIEGIIFCGSGIALLSYSLLSQAKAFNKEWAQSPYLFPLIVGIAMIGLALCILGEGIAAMKRETASAGKAEGKKDSAEKLCRVLISLVLCGIYYLVLANVRIPSVSFMILSLRCSFSIFEAATVAFLIVMMAFMGVRKPAVLVCVPIGTTLFLSIAFRSMLHVLLP